MRDENDGLILRERGYLLIQRIFSHRVERRRRLSSAALGAALSPAAAAPLLVFCLLYTPCIAAVASVKREMGGRWATVMVVNQCVVAWLAALVVRILAVAVL